MKNSYGVQMKPPSESSSVEATVIRRLYDKAHEGVERGPWPLTHMFYALKAEYRHLSREQRTAKLPAFVLAALNDPHGGIAVVPLSDSHASRVA